MKVLVAGGTGFVGSHLLQALLKRGHEVVALVRPPTLLKMKSTFAPGIETREGNVLDLKSLVHAIQGCEVVINLVGIIRERRDKGITFKRLHVDATRNMIEACNAAGVRRYLHMSALGASPISKSHYHRTKFMAEELVRSSGLKYSIFQPSIIIGRGSQFLEGMRKIMRTVRVLGLVGGGKYRLQPVSINDVVRAFTLALERGDLVNDSFQLCGPKISTLRELILTMARVWGIRVFILPLPERPLDLLAPIFDKFSWFPITRDQLFMLKEENICSSNSFFTLTWSTPEEIEGILKVV